MSSHCVVLQHFLFTSFFALLTVSVASEKTPITYNDHVKPIFRQHCLKCHGDDKQKAGINLHMLMYLKEAVQVRLLSLGDPARAYCSK